MRLRDRLDWRRWLSPARRLAWYPPLRSLRIRVEEFDLRRRRVRIQLPIHRRTRNPGGTMFGGAMAALADPVPALLCARIFPDYLVWTRAMQIDFRQPGTGDLELRFVLEPDDEARIRDELARRGRSTPTFEFGFYRGDGSLCAWVRNTVAIRRPGDMPGTGGALGRPSRRPLPREQRLPDEEQER